MADIGDFSKAKQIRSLLYVLGTGIFSAILLALGMLYYYNPTGSYLAKNVLLDPESAFALKFSEGTSKSKGRLSFDRIDFSYYNETAKQMMMLAIDQQRYAQFYELVKNEVSLTQVDDATQALFNHGRPAILTLKVNVTNDNFPKGQLAAFSEVDFAEAGDYYRVQLRQEGARASWAYFRHPGIYQKALNIFSITP